VGIFLSPVSNEHFLAAQHFDLDGGDLIRLTQLAVDSIFGSEADKERMRQLLDEFESSLAGEA
jgi:adenosine deaminase